MFLVVHLEGTLRADQGRLLEEYRACLCPFICRMYLLDELGIGITVTRCLFTSLELAQTTSWSLTLTKGSNAVSNWASNRMSLWKVTRSWME